MNHPSGRYLALGLIALALVLVLVGLKFRQAPIDPAVRPVTPPATLPSAR